MTHRLETKRLTRNQRTRQASPQRSGYEGAAAVSEHGIRERRIGKIEIKVLRARLGAHPYSRKTGKFLYRERRMTAIAIHIKIATVASAVTGIKLHFRDKARLVKIPDDIVLSYDDGVRRSLLRVYRRERPCSYGDIAQLIRQIEQIVKFLHIRHRLEIGVVGYRT